MTDKIVLYGRNFNDFYPILSHRKQSCNNLTMIKQSNHVENLSSPEARAKRVKYVRENLLNISRSELCKDSILKEGSLKGWELAAMGGLTEKGAEKLVARFKELGIYCTTPWLLHEIGYGPTRKQEHIDISNSEEEQIAKELLEFRQQPNAIDTIIKDDSMLPLLAPGNFVAGIVARNIKTAINKECIIVMPDHSYLVRILQSGDDPGRYTLSSLNKNPSMMRQEIKNVSIIAAAPIILIRKKNPER